MSFGLSAAAWIGIGTAVVGAGSSVYSANRNSAASRRATAAAGDANSQNLQLARDERAGNERLYAPDIARGNRADAFRDAINYGAGRYRTSPGGGAAGVSGAPTSDYNEFFDWWFPTTQSGGTRLNTTNPWWTTNGAAVAGLGDDGEWSDADKQAWAEAYSSFTGEQIPETYGDTYGEYDGTTLEGEYTDVTQADIDGLVRNQFGWRQGDEDFSYNEGLTDDAFNYDMGLLGDQRDTSYARADRGLDDRNALARAAYDSQLDLYDEGYGEGADLYGQQYDTRRGITQDAIDARGYLNERARGDFLDRAGSSFGVTGRLGAVQNAYARNIADENAAYANTVRGYQMEDYDPYATGMNQLTSWRANGRVGAGQDRDSRAWDAYNAYDDIYGQADAGYYSGALTASGQRTGRRFSNNAARSGARTDAYNQWQNGINADSDRGVNARSGIAGTTNTFTNRATAANNSNAAAYGQNAQNHANIWGAAAGQIASSVGDAWGAYSRNRNPYGTNTQPGDPPFPI